MNQVPVLKTPVTTLTPVPVLQVGGGPHALVAHFLRLANFAQELPLVV